MTLTAGSSAEAILSAPSLPFTSLCENDGGEAMYRLIAELYPICRSMTGDNVRAALDLLRAHVPITVHEVRSGPQLFDWSIASEWNLRDGHIQNRASERVVDFSKSNPHVDYSRRVSATPRSGYLTWGEVLLRGRSLQELLIFCHICHPSSCHGNLSGIAVAAALAQRLLLTRTRHSYRFLFIPCTIGSITWLALNQSRALRVKHSLLLDCHGDFGKPSYEKSRRGDAEVDRAVAFVLREASEDCSIDRFSPFGYDEGQFCNPGFDLPVGRRTPGAVFPQYRTSADDLAFVEPRHLYDSFMKLLTVIDVLENNRVYANRSPYGEPKLGKYDLTHLPESATDGEYRRALLWVFNSSDGSKSLLDVASDGNLRWDVAKEAARGLVARGLITPIEGSRRLLRARKRRVNSNFN